MLWCCVADIDKIRGWKTTCKVQQKDRFWHSLLGVCGRFKTRGKTDLQDFLLSPEGPTNRPKSGHLLPKHGLTSAQHRVLVFLSKFGARSLFGPLRLSRFPQNQVCFSTTHQDQSEHYSSSATQRALWPELPGVSCIASLLQSSAGKQQKLRRSLG